MLIRAMRAENFMRFSRLEIASLPARGLIGIEGPNETGKSTIGELFLFVLLGKTRGSCESGLTSLIRWGEDSMCAELEVSVTPAGDGETLPGAASADYLIYRQVDKYGTNYVKVLELPERREVASGNGQATELIARLLGLGFDELQQSFFHDQHGGRKVAGPPLGFFETAAGLKHLRWAADALRLEVEPLEKEFVYLQRELSRTADQAEKHQKHAIKVPELTHRAGKLSETCAARAKRLTEIKRQSELLRSDAGQLESRARRIDQLHEGTLAAGRDELERLRAQAVPASLREPRQADDGVLLAAHQTMQGEVERAHGVIAGIVALKESLVARHDGLRRVLEDRGGDSTAVKLEAAQAAARASRSALRARGALAAGLAAVAVALAAVGILAWRGMLTAPSAWPEPARPTFAGQFLGLAGACAAAAWFAWSRRTHARRWSRQAASDIESLGAEIEGQRAAAEALGPVTLLAAVKEAGQILSCGESSGDPAVMRAATALRQALADGPTDGDGALEPRLAALARAERDLRGRFLTEAQRIEKVAQEEDAAHRKLAADKERVESELKECQTQLVKREALLERRAELLAQAEKIRDEIELKRHASRLLDETIDGVRARMGPALTRFVKSVLPQITAGRYRDVKVDEDLRIKIYSSDKNDFLALPELSGGTGEALLLALRLAVAHAFTATRTGHAHFVFLDEPFKMMDAERIASTLHVLSKLSATLQQIFVAQPNFSAGARDQFDFLIRMSAAGVVETGKPAVAAQTVGA